MRWALRAKIIFIGYVISSVKSRHNHASGILISCITDKKNDNKIGRGTYGIVYSVSDKEIIKSYSIMDGGGDDGEIGIPTHIIRELSALSLLSECNRIMRVKCVDPTLTCLRADRYDYSLEHAMCQKTSEIEVENIPFIIRSILLGLSDIKNNLIFHRDIKPSNILIRHIKDKTEIALCDFGLCRFIDSVDAGHIEQLTGSVQTLLYRAPETLLESSHYDQKIDMWSVGILTLELYLIWEYGDCYEILNNDMDSDSDELTEYQQQLKTIFNIFGLPTDNTWRGISRNPNYQAILPHVSKLDQLDIKDLISNASDTVIDALEIRSLIS